MACVVRATSTLLLLLAAGGAASCDADAPAERPRVAQLPASVARPAPEPDPVLDEPIRAPEPPPAERSSFNRFSSSPAPKKAAPSGYTPPAAPARAGREILPGSDACESARRGALRMQGYVESIEREIERLEESANDIEYSDRSREHFEARRDAAEERLDRAEDELGDYLQNERQRGVPPGCLR